MFALFTNNTYKTFEVFIQQPHTNHSARAIARTIKLTHPTVLKHLQQLQEHDLIQENNNTLYTTYRANTQHTLYKHLKQQYWTTKIKTSGLIEDITKTTQPSIIVLFGSTARGEDNQNSDIDIYVQAQHQELNLNNYEQALGRNISILFEANPQTLTQELRTNIRNGIILYGQWTTSNA